jgi:hypothetical protein
MAKFKQGDKPGVVWQKTPRLPIAQFFDGEFETFIDEVVAVLRSLGYEEVKEKRTVKAPAKKPDTPGVEGAVKKTRKKKAK